MDVCADIKTDFYSKQCQSKLRPCSFIPGNLCSWAAVINTEQSSRLNEPLWVSSDSYSKRNRVNQKPYSETALPSPENPHVELCYKASCCPSEHLFKEETNTDSGSFSSPLHHILKHRLERN